MNNDNLRAYKNDLPAASNRRIKAFLLDAFVLMAVAFGLIITSMTALSNMGSYQFYAATVKTEMLACYQIEEEAKIYQFIGEGEDKYSNPRSSEAIFEDYCLMHILYTYSLDATPFTNYGIEIENPKNLPLASYETDTLAYFYVYYAADNNSYNGKENDVVPMDDNAQFFFYKQLKDNMVRNDIWVFDEQSYALPHLDSYFAIDLYKYLFVDDAYQAGLTNYNYLATGYLNLWNKQVDELIASSRFQDHYLLYKENYAKCAFLMDGAISLSYLVAFLGAYILPQFFLKDGKTLGKKVFSIRVIDDKGYKATLIQQLGRNSAIFLSMFGVMIIPTFLAGGLNAGWLYPVFEITGIGFSLFSIMVIFLFLEIVSLLVMIISKKKKALHDFITDTMCIDERYHLSPTESEEILKEQERKELKALRNDELAGEHFLDSSSFNNTERKTHDD